MAYLFFAHRLSEKAEMPRGLLTCNVVLRVKLGKPSVSCLSLLQFKSPPVNRARKCGESSQVTLWWHGEAKDFSRSQTSLLPTADCASFAAAKQGQTRP